MTALCNPPGLVSTSLRRRRRHRNAAARLALHSPLSASSGDESEVSFTAIVESSLLDDDSNRVANCCGTGGDAWYIGESMLDCAVQTDLSTNPSEELAYSVDPVLLVEAAIHNAFINLRRNVESCIEHASELLDATVPVEDVLSVRGSDSSDDDPPGVDDGLVESSIRLCGLRLDKVGKQWEAIRNAATLEIVSSHGGGEYDGAEEGFSLFLDGVTTFCEYVQELVQNERTFGVWSNGMAVYDVYMAEFGELEGTEAVWQHMRLLDIEPTANTKTILSLALRMVINNQCELESYPDRF